MHISYLVEFFQEVVSSQLDQIESGEFSKRPKVQAMLLKWLKLVVEAYPQKPPNMSVYIG